MGIHLKSEHVVGLGITIGLIFVTGAASGAGLFTFPETLFAVVVSVILGFMPVATLFRSAPGDDLAELETEPSV